MRFGKTRIVEGEDLKNTIEHYKVLEEMNNRLEIELQHMKLNYWYRKWQKMLNELKAELGEETPLTGAPTVVKDDTGQAPPEPEVTAS